VLAPRAAWRADVVAATWSAWSDLPPEVCQSLSPSLSGRLHVSALVSLQAAEPSNFESVRLEYGRGTRGSASAVSSSEDRLVLSQLAETLLELRQRDVDRTLIASELLDLLGLANVEEDHVPL